MKQEEPEVPNKDPKGFQTLKLSAQSSASAVPATQPPVQTPKYWRDRALQAEARLADRDRQVQKQNAVILDLSWKAKVAEDWTQWWETHSEAYTRKGYAS